MTEQLEGQVSMFDHATCCGRTCQEQPLREKTKTETPSKEKTSGVSSKKRQGSSRKMPISLDLRRKDGQVPDASWEKGILLPGRYTMPSTTEFRSVESGLLYSLTSEDTQQERYCLHLNTSEKPREPNPTILSDILEEEADARYELSKKACIGILRRAGKRGKQLPEILQEALERQANA